MIASPAIRPLGFVGLWVCGVLLLALVPPVSGDATKKVAPKKGNNLFLQARVAPADPFSEENRVDMPAEKMHFARGSTFLVVISGRTSEGHYTYPLTQKAPNQTGKLAQLSVEGDNFQLLYPALETPPEWKTVKGIDPELVHKKPFTWIQEVYIKPTAPVGKTDVTLKLQTQVCSKSCVDENHVVKVPLTISNGPAAPVSDALKIRLDAKVPAPTVIPVPPDLQGKDGKDDPVPERVVPDRLNKERDGWRGLITSIGTAIGGGIISLLTPCVFPMIPITVSYFLKQAEARKKKNLAPALMAGTGTGITTAAAPAPAPAEDEPASHSPLLMAAIYSGTIVVVLSAGGLALLQVLLQISTHPITNFIIGGLFLVFALSLLGWYDITLPSWLQDLTASREGKGGLAGVVFMALTFSIISFACVGPIYGSFISLQASSGGALGVLERVLPVVAYSVAFASPFFLLALFPALMQTMPKAGSWMNAVKVVMGFLELAAVVKFVRAGELLWKGKTDILTYDVSLGLYVAISLLCGLYLLGMYRLPHDHDAPESISVPRLLFSLAFITLGLYMMPGLFKNDSGQSQRPTGTIFAWIKSFLLPDPETPGASSGRASAHSLQWNYNLEEALAKAEQEKKLLFIDFTGTSCTNCKLNERNVFPRPEVRELLSRHVLLQLDAHTIPAGTNQQPDVAGTLKLLKDRFDTTALPLYVLVRPKGKDFETVGVFGENGNGLIEDVPAFVKFLDRSAK